MIVIVDNYDSFTYNLVQRLGELGADVRVHRNDHVSVDAIADERPDHIIISPGPCTPDEAGISCEIVRRFAGKVPLLGVCLGHQCIGQAYGGRVVRAGRLMHGKTSMIAHDGRTIFGGLANPFRATRYHSLAVEETSMPACLEATARTEQGELMALRHRELPVEGVQFHPESFLTDEGPDLIKNFLEMTA